jgi:hypothetical protein
LEPFKTFEHSENETQLTLLVIKLYNEVTLLKRNYNILKKNLLYPYITIKNFQNLKFNFKDWNLTLNKLFFENYLPQMWITKKIQYVPKNKNQVIVYVFVISQSVKQHVIKKLSLYCNEHLFNVTLY